MSWPPEGAVRVDSSLRRGQKFRAMDGKTYEYVRVDAALSGVHHVIDEKGFKTAFAGCAEVVLLP